jgi:hypothetical protein
VREQIARPARMCKKRHERLLRHAGTVRRSRGEGRAALPPPDGFSGHQNLAGAGRAPGHCTAIRTSAITAGSHGCAPFHDFIGLFGCTQNVGYAGGAPPTSRAGSAGAKSLGIAHSHDRKICHISAPQAIQAPRIVLFVTLWFSNAENRGIQRLKEGALESSPVEISSPPASKGPRAS